MEVSESRGWYKRPFDLAILLGAHMILFPLWLVLWTVIPLAIWITDGRPIFYRARRMGRYGRVFTALKFRTMVVGADAVGMYGTVQNDPRITKVGAILRKTGFDELPQIINILRGEMSFVGPRPYNVNSFEAASQKDPQFGRRLAVRPGLTSLAAIYSNQLSDERDHLRYDVLYMRKMSPLLDLKLLFFSWWITFRGRWEKHKRAPVKEAQ